MDHDDILHIYMPVLDNWKIESVCLIASDHNLKDFFVLLSHHNEGGNVAALRKTRHNNFLKE